MNRSLPKTSFVGGKRLPSGGVPNRVSVSLRLIVAPVASPGTQYQSREPCNLSSRNVFDGTNTPREAMADAVRGG